MIPARLVVGRDVHHLLRVSAASGSGDRARWAQRLFVVGQVACATVLLTGAGLMARTVLHFARVDLGFQANRLVTGAPSFPHTWRVPEKYLPVTERILAELSLMPGAAVGSHSRHESAAEARRACGDHARGKRRAAAGRTRPVRRALRESRLLHHVRRTCHQGSRVQ